MTDKPKVRWEFRHTDEWEQSTPIEDGYVWFENMRASVDGSDPKTPLQWLEEMRSEAQALGRDDAYDTDWGDFENGYAALRDLLGGSQ